MTGFAVTLRDLERRRLDAIAAGDGEALSALLVETYVHVHLNGFLDDRAGHVEKVVANPRITERGELKIRVLGEAAILNGTATNIMRRPDGSEQRIEANCQQAAVRTLDGWRIVLTQMTRISQG